MTEPTGARAASTGHQDMSMQGPGIEPAAGRSTGKRDLRTNEMGSLDGSEKMVRMGRLELPRAKALEPKSSVSTNSTTSACRVESWHITDIFYGCKLFQKNVLNNKTQ